MSIGLSFIDNEELMFVNVHIYTKYLLQSIGHPPSGAAAQKGGTHEICMCMCLLNKGSLLTLKTPLLYFRVVIHFLLRETIIYHDRKETN